MKFALKLFALMVALLSGLWLLQPFEMFWFVVWGLPCIVLINSVIDDIKGERWPRE